MGEHYVYHHIDKENVFYVGKGRNARALDITSRNAGWVGYFNTIKDRKFTVRIVKYFDSNYVARLYEIREILRLKPIGNAEVYNQVKAKGLATMSKRLREKIRLSKEKLAPKD